MNQLILPDDHINVDTQQLIVPSREIFSGRFLGEIVRKDGRIDPLDPFNNTAFVAGKNNLWEVYFRGGSQVSTWYSGLIDNSGFTAFNYTTDTMSSHSGWSEYTGYSESARVTWSANAAASGSIANTTLMQFTFTSTQNIKGAFIVNNSTKGGTTGILWAAAAFGSVQAVNSGDVLRLIYTASV